MSSAHTIYDLITAAQEGDQALAEACLNAGVDHREPANESGDTALHLAAYEGHDNIVALLLKRGANPNQTNKNGENPLHYAAHEGRPRIVTLLLERGADLTQKNIFELTPLDMASVHPRSGVREILLNRRWNPLRSAFVRAVAQFQARMDGFVVGAASPKIGADAPTGEASATAFHQAESSVAGGGGSAGAADLQQNPDKDEDSDGLIP